MVLSASTCAFYAHGWADVRMRSHAGVGRSKTAWDGRYMKNGGIAGRTWKTSLHLVTLVILRMADNDLPFFG